MAQGRLKTPLSPTLSPTQAGRKGEKQRIALLVRVGLRPAPTNDSVCKDDTFQHPLGAPLQRGCLVFGAGLGSVEPLRCLAYLWFFHVFFISA